MSVARKKRRRSDSPEQVIEEEKYEQPFECERFYHVCLPTSLTREKARKANVSWYSNETECKKLCRGIEGSLPTPINEIIEGYHDARVYVKICDKRPLRNVMNYIFGIFGIGQKESEWIKV